MDCDDVPAMKLIAAVALFPALGLMWFFLWPSTALLESLLIAAVSYLFGLFLSLAFLLLALPAFNFLLDLWWTLREDHRSSRPPDGDFYAIDGQAVIGPELRDRHSLDII